MENNDPNNTRDFNEVRDRAESYVRDEPAKAVGIAVLAGIFLTVFPVASVVFGVMRLALGLLKPALIILGAMKLYEEVEKRYGA